MAEAKKNQAASVADAQQFEQSDSDSEQTQTGPTTATPATPAKPDVAYTASEVVERLLGTLDQYPVTPLGHGWLKEERLHFAQPFRNEIVKAATVKGAQLSLVEVQAKVAEIRSRLAKREAEKAVWRENLHEQLDETALPTDGRCEGCGRTMNPHTRNRMDKDGNVFVFRTGPRAGEVIREGDFFVSDDGNVAELLLLERECARMYRVKLREQLENRADLRSFSRADAERIATAINDRRKEKEATNDRLSQLAFNGIRRRLGGYRR